MALGSLLNINLLGNETSRLTGVARKDWVQSSADCWEVGSRQLQKKPRLIAAVAATKALLPFFSDKETYVISLESILFNAVKVSANPLLSLSPLLPLTHNVDFVNHLPESSQHWFLPDFETPLGKHWYPHIRDPWRLVRSHVLRLQVDCTPWSDVIEKAS